MSDTLEVSDVCVRLAQAVYFDAPQDEPSIADAASRGLPFYDTGSERDPLAVLAQAARGDVMAMRELADASVYLALAGTENVDPFLALSEGLMLARMAASLGDPDDQMRAVSMLSLASLMTTGDASRELAGEAIARLELLADHGGAMGENAASLLATSAHCERADTLERAKHFRARLYRKEPA